LVLGTGKQSDYCPSYFTLREKAPQCPMDSTLCASESQPGHFGDEKKPLPLLEIDPELFGTWHLNSTTCYSLSYYMSEDFRSQHGFKYSHAFTG